MVKYLDLLKVKTFELRQEISELNKKLRDTELEVVKEYFKLGKTVIYQDFDGWIKGEVVEVNSYDITVKVNCVNGNTDENVCRGLKTYKACQLNLY